MANLAAIRDRVEQYLADTGNTIWDTDWIDEGIRQALNEYNLAVPYRKIATYTLSGYLSSNGKEIDLSNLSDVGTLIEINRVIVPYTATDTIELKQSFQYFRDAQTIFLFDHIAESTDTARLFYTIPHTIEDLDSAAATTVWNEHETMLITGASGHVAASRSLDLTEQVTVDRLTAQQARAWGLSKLQEFRSALRAASRTSGSGTPWINLPELDRWDKN